MGNPPPNLRRATRADLPALARLHRHAFFTAMPHMPVLHTPTEDLAFYTNIVFPGTEIWLIESEAEATGLPVGFIAFRPGWIDHLYLHPAHQRRGLGTQLLQLAQRAYPALQLWTFQCNLPARTFYERHGFQLSRQTDGTDNEERQPDILYVWTRSVKTPP